MRVLVRRLRRLEMGLLPPAETAESRGATKSFSTSGGRVQQGWTYPDRKTLQHPRIGPACPSATRHGRACSTLQHMRARWVADEAGISATRGVPEYSRKIRE